MKEGLVRYQVSKTNGGPSYHEWPAAEVAAEERGDGGDTRGSGAE